MPLRSATGTSESGVVSDRFAGHGQLNTEISQQRVVGPSLWSTCTLMRCDLRGLSTTCQPGA